MKSKVLKAALVLSLLLAMSFAAYLWFGHNNAVEERLAESVRRSERVLERYLSAEDDVAKQAMLEHIDYLDKLSRESGDETRNPYAFDAMTWCVRLAQVEERGKGSMATEYMRDAVARCQKLGKADCSEDGLRHQVERMDSVALARLKK